MPDGGVTRRVMRLRMHPRPELLRTFDFCAIISEILVFLCRSVPWFAMIRREQKHGYIEAGYRKRPPSCHQH